MKSLPVFTILLFLTICSTAQLKFIAHRGVSYYAPENTMASIKLAWELGADGAECDIHMTKDKKIILSHDGTTTRLTNQKLDIARTNYSELKKLELKLIPTNSPYFSGERMPLLADVLKTIPKDRLLVIEIKCENDVFPELEKVIKKYWKTGKIAFIGFNFETISLAKSKFPNVPCYYLSSSKEDVQKRIPDLKKNNLDGVDLSSKIIDKELVDELRKANAEIWCWTVDNLTEALRMKNLGVNIITTNRPTWLKEQIIAIK